MTTEIESPVGGEADDTWRGGSNGLWVPRHGRVVGFGRRTVKQHRSLYGLEPDFTHRVFLWTLDPGTWRLRTYPVNGPCGAISAPISLREEGGKYFLSTVEGSGSFGKDRVLLYCDLYEVTDVLEGL